ncbi:hypothetical protein AKJ64_04445 [candidate division MSBL1 archaeon SCGC-AAA259E17]|uniref:Uncharacterized protein n=1 Tax=candidate division MSBL1 archaeon SCGC-AAA259E17 TaxID=1698263 RepID=A0A133UCD8_9EURY|nr:hypothetical protein AKJ64_04445 [candidate division MSBL1 archaeon SCGC-AAA259E17]
MGRESVRFDPWRSLSHMIDLRMLYLRAIVGFGRALAGGEALEGARNEILIPANWSDRRVSTFSKLLKELEGKIGIVENDLMINHFDDALLKIESTALDFCKSCFMRSSPYVFI